ncbi:hypothetical protein F8R89_01155 [Streptomyces sp. SS1-1]|uniref:hypothetical protein n=1 Tax=Streptomyces sp. SS1-1 TaxID=2651869 RepID=UPI00124FFA04|nr:hypothetical protein [Streptomyces sp. SS1-1]KAB2977476.1 hypothetical protein F8R89_01155 [Streptomyces sp. SS1-1]
MLGRNLNQRRRRLPEYDLTPEIKAAQDEVLTAHYGEALVRAFTCCSDPRTDTVDIVEKSFARLEAGWMLYERDPRLHLFELVEEYSVRALRRVPARWEPDSWYTANYVRLFKDVASAEELAALKAILAIDEEGRRKARGEDNPRVNEALHVYEARRVYGWPVDLTSKRMGVNQNSVGPMTSRIERKIDRTAGAASAAAAQALFNRYMQKGGGF